MTPALQPIPLRLNVRASERMPNLWLTMEHNDGVGEKRLAVVGSDDEFAVVLLSGGKKAGRGLGTGNTVGGGR